MYSECVNNEQKTQLNFRIVPLGTIRKYNGVLCRDVNLILKGAK